MGKGSGRRPTNEAAFQENWQRIFGTKSVEVLQDALSAASFADDLSSEEPLGVGAIEGGDGEEAPQNQNTSTGLDSGSS